MCCNNCKIFSYRLQSACCCCEVRTGALVITSLSIIGSVIEIVQSSILISRCQESTVQEESSGLDMLTLDTTLCNYHAATPKVTLALTVIYLVFSLLLMVGLTQASDLLKKV